MFGVPLQRYVRSNFKVGPKKAFFCPQPVGCVTARGDFGPNFSNTSHKWICVHVWLRSVQWPPRLGVEKRKKKKLRKKKPQRKSRCLENYSKWLVQCRAAETEKELRYRSMYRSTCVGCSWSVLVGRWIRVRLSLRWTITKVKIRLVENVGHQTAWLAARDAAAKYQMSFDAANGGLLFRLSWSGHSQ